MKDPERLLDGGGEADDFELAVLGSAARDRGSDRALGRALARVGAAGVGAAGALAAASTAAQSAAATAPAAATGSGAAAAGTAGSFGLAKWLALAVLGGAIGGGGVAFVRGTPPAAPAVVAAGPSAPTDAPLVAGSRPNMPPPNDPALALPRGDDIAPMPPQVGVDSSPQPTTSSAPRARRADEPRAAARDTTSAAGATEPARNSDPAPGSPGPVAATPQVGVEIALLDRVRAELAARRPAGALAALDAYQRDFPGGVLAPEALVLRIEALLQAGDRNGAAALARPLLEGSSPHATRIRLLFQREAARGTIP